MRNHIEDEAKKNGELNSPAPAGLLFLGCETLNNLHPERGRKEKFFFRGFLKNEDIQSQQKMRRQKMKLVRRKMREE